MPSAADLKFQPPPRTRSGTLNRRHQNHIIASARSFPKLVSETAAMYHELRKPGTSLKNRAVAADADRRGAIGPQRLRDRTARRPRAAFQNFSQWQRLGVAAEPCAQHVCQTIEQCDGK